MISQRAVKQAGVAVAVGVALCMMSSPSGATAIWGGGRRVALTSSSSESGRAGWRANDGSRAGWQLNDGSRAGWQLNDGSRAGWRANDGSRAGWRLSEGSRAGWRLYILIQAMRAGW